MVSRRRCGGGSIGDDTAEVPLPAGLPDNSAWAAQPLRKFVNSAAVAIHVSDLCITLSLPFSSLVIVPMIVCPPERPEVAGHEDAEVFGATPGRAHRQPARRF